jgi:glyoxylase-like metal-dependent hydrolase (beta-lactamase superfamily II)
MPCAPEIEPVAPGIFIWRFYDPAVKAELFSTGLQTPSGIFLFDPIPLAPEALAELRSSGNVAGLIVTNENHERAAAQFAADFATPIYRDGALPEAGLTVIPVPGAPAGEIAVHFNERNGTMIIGDALINFEPHGFALLPTKYCTDARAMRQSLRQLLDYSFERMFFAHGLPILTSARERLEQLLNEQR